MTATRLGRISQATYIKEVGRMLTRDWFALEQCDVLTQLEIVGQLVSAYPNKYLSPGWAVRAILDKAIAQVIAVSRSSKDEHTRRIALFLELRQQGESVSSIARSWGLSRECVSRTVSRQAIQLVTDRVLKLARRSPNSQEADVVHLVKAEKTSA